jgi:hypothetical protein
MTSRIQQVPVMDGQTFDIQTKNPSEGLNACNTIYNFYAVNQEGKYEPKGKFRLKRSSETSLKGMILAPQGKEIKMTAMVQLKLVIINLHSKLYFSSHY